MNRNQVITRAFKVGKHSILLIKIIQKANARSNVGNALATNLANVVIKKKKKK